MKIRKAALLLVAVLMVLAASPAPASSASCEGACGASEVIIDCPWTMSASQCCGYAQRICGGSFSGVCAGDAEILCG